MSYHLLLTVCAPHRLLDPPVYLGHLLDLNALPDYIAVSVCPPHHGLDLVPPEPLVPVLIYIVLNECGLLVWLKCESESQKQAGEFRAFDRLPQVVQLQVLVHEVEDQEEVSEVRLQVRSGGLEGDG